MKKKKKKKSVEHWMFKVFSTESQAEDSRVRLDGVRAGPDYLFGPGSHPGFDYSQRFGPSLFISKGGGEDEPEK